MSWKAGNLKSALHFVVFWALYVMIYDKIKFSTYIQDNS